LRCEAGELSLGLQPDSRSLVALPCSVSLRCVSGCRISKEDVCSLEMEKDVRSPAFWKASLIAHSLIELIHLKQEALEGSVTAQFIAMERVSG
jgi:hypothetical protein